MTRTTRIATALAGLAAALPAAALAHPGHAGGGLAHDAAHAVPALGQIPAALAVAAFALLVAGRAVGAVRARPARA